MNATSFWMPPHLVLSAWLEHGPFAFWITDALRPKTIVELGTHSGFSYFAFCEAVRRLDLNTECFALDTWEGDDHAGFYDESVFEVVNQVNNEHYAGFSHLIRGCFDDALPRFADGSIDLLHIDGRHGYEDVKHDYESWVPKLSDRAVVLFHDIAEHSDGFGVWKLWRSVSSEAPSFAFEHGHGLGVLVVGKNAPSVMTDFVAAGRAQGDRIAHDYASLGGQVRDRYYELLDRSELRSKYYETLAELEATKARLARIESSRSWQLVKRLQGVSAVLPRKASR